MILVGIWIVLLVLTVGGGMWAFNWRLSDRKNVIGIVTALPSFLLTIGITFSFIMNHATANSTIVQYNTIKETIEVSRQGNVSDVERATLTQKIMEVNQEIASNKYWNGTIFDIMIPDKLAELEPLK